MIYPVTYIKQNNPKINFKGNAPMSKNMTTKEKTENISNLAVSKLKERTKDLVPEKGDFVRIAQAFEIPDTKYAAVLAVENSCDENENKRILILTGWDTSSNTVNCILKSGTKKEILEYLSDKNTVNNVAYTLNEISKTLRKRNSIYY